MRSPRDLNGTAVKALREAFGISQGDLAERCGIASSYLCNLERGRRQPSPMVARRIAGALGVPLDAVTRATVTRAACDCLAEQEAAS